LPCQDAIPALPAVTDADRDVDGDLRGYRNLLDNQPSLFAALDALDWENTPVSYVMHDRGHGRDETPQREGKTWPSPIGPREAISSSRSGSVPPCRAAACGPGVGEFGVWPAREC
jgi:hypothetical protein